MNKKKAGLPEGEGGDAAPGTLEEITKIAMSDTTGPQCFLIIKFLRENVFARPQNAISIAKSP